MRRTLIVVALLLAGPAVLLCAGLVFFAYLIAPVPAVLGTCAGAFLILWRLDEPNRIAAQRREAELAAAARRILSRPA